MCDREGKKSQLYAAVVARLKELFEITSHKFEPDLLAVVRKHCQGGKAPRLKTGTARCRQMYKDISSYPMYKETFEGIVHLFKIKNVPLFYEDVGDVVVAYCGLQGGNAVKKRKYRKTQRKIHIAK